MTAGTTIDTIIAVAADIESLVSEMRANPTNVRFADACRVANHFFGPPRRGATSHQIWRMPWPGDPRVNMQNDRGKAKAYQVRQLLEAVDRLRQDQGGGTA